MQGKLIMDEKIEAINMLFALFSVNFVKELNNGKVSEDEIYDMKPRNAQLKSELLAEMFDDEDDIMKKIQTAMEKRIQMRMR